jgi:hypothetical protein
MKDRAPATTASFQRRFLQSSLASESRAAGFFGSGHAECEGAFAGIWYKG